MSNSKTTGGTELSGSRSDDATRKLVDPAEAGDKATTKYANDAALYAFMLRANIVFKINEEGENGFMQLVRCVAKTTWEQSPEEQQIAEERLNLMLDRINDFYQSSGRARGIVSWLIKSAENQENAIQRNGTTIAIFARTLGDLTEYAREIKNTLQQFDIEVKEGDELTHVTSSDSRKTDGNASDQKQTRGSEKKIARSVSAEAGIEVKMAPPGIFKMLLKWAGFEGGAKASVNAGLEAKKENTLAHEDSESKTHEEEASRKTSIESATKIDPLLTSRRMTDMLSIFALMEVNPGLFKLYRETFSSLRSNVHEEYEDAMADLEQDTDRLTQISTKLNDLRVYLSEGKDTTAFLNRYLPQTDTRRFKDLVAAGKYEGAFKLLEKRSEMFYERNKQTGQLFDTRLSTRSLERLENIRSMLLVGCVIDNFVQDYRQADRYAKEMAGIKSLEQKGLINNRTRAEFPVISSEMSEEDYQGLSDMEMTVISSQCDERGNSYYMVEFNTPNLNSVDQIKITGLCSNMPGLRVGERYLLTKEQRRKNDTPIVVAVPCKHLERQREQLLNPTSCPVNPSQNERQRVEDQVTTAREKVRKEFLKMMGVNENNGEIFNIIKKSIENDRGQNRSPTPS